MGPDTDSESYPATTSRTHYTSSRSDQFFDMVDVTFTDRIHTLRTPVAGTWPAEPWMAWPDPSRDGPYKEHLPEVDVLETRILEDPPPSPSPSRCRPSGTP